MLVTGLAVGDRAALVLAALDDDRLGRIEIDEHQMRVAFPVGRPAGVDHDAVAGARDVDVDGEAVAGLLQLGERA